MGRSAAPAPAGRPHGDEHSGGGPPLLHSPVFWAAVGGVALASTAVVLFALRPDDPPTKASLAPAIRCGADLCK
jgi:hypothetical protein